MIRGWEYESDGLAGLDGCGRKALADAPNEQVQPAKTLWDWLQLLVVPVILIVVTLFWSAQQTAKSDRAATEDARRDVTLRSYLDQMSGLMLDKRLLASERGSAIRAVARTLTHTTLRRLDGERKGEVMRFVFEAGLLNRSDPLVNLDFADLKGAQLEDASLARTNLTRALLVNAVLVGANLRRADLMGADLTNADLTNADLTEANLRDSNLTNADLTGADLSSAQLADADLTGANLAHADFRGADLAGADLTETIRKGAKGLPEERP